MDKITKVEINIQEAVKELFPITLVKDLTEYERICHVCHGLGMKIDDNNYGIKGDTSECGKKYLFPYKHQAFSFCPNCFNGVQKLCPYCGEPYKNQGYTHCDCEGQKNADIKEQFKKWKELLNKAVIVNEKDIDTMLYCKEFNKYYDSTKDFFDDYSTNYNETCIKPERLWVTNVEKISADASYVIENACQELHEDAIEECDESSLQKLLDDWCKEQTGTTTYYPSYEKYVVVDWDSFNKKYL